MKEHKYSSEVQTPQSCRTCSTGDTLYFLSLLLFTILSLILSCSTKTNLLCSSSIIIKFDSTWLSSFSFSLSLLNLIWIYLIKSQQKTLINSKGGFILQNPVPRRLLVFRNSIFAFTFFVLFRCEKLCLAWSPPLQILQLHPWALWWHHVEKCQL